MTSDRKPRFSKPSQPDIIESMFETPRWSLYAVRIAALGSTIYFSLYHRWRCEGLDKLPLHGPLLMTINHLSMMDVIALGAALVLKGLRPGIDFFTASKQELYTKPILPRLMPLLGMFPLYRERPDMSAMRRMLDIFHAGKILAIAPEGTRSPTGRLQLFQPVIAKIAITRRVPILPIGLIGTDKAMPIGAKFPRPAQIIIRIGDVYELDRYYGLALTPDVLAQAAWEMRARVAALLPEPMRELPPADTPTRFGAVRPTTSASKEFPHTKF